MALMVQSLFPATDPEGTWSLELNVGPTKILCTHVVLS